MNSLHSLKVAVFMGGYSEEREVSLRSGQAAADALRSAGCQVVEVDVKDDQPEIPNGTSAVFMALHGTGGEDGVIQSYLEQKGIPFTGSGAESSRVAFDKVAAKEIFRKVGIQVAREVVVRGKEELKKCETVSFGFPRVIKPSRQGSSVGIRIVRSEKEMRSAMDSAMAKDDLVLIEEFIPGRELTVGVLGDRALTVIEICPKNGWYDYTNKYTKGSTEYLLPAPISPELAQKVRNDAWNAHCALGCRDVSRADFRLNPDGETFILEVNTLPGLTETSLLPKSAQAEGVTFSNLCLELVRRAVVRGGKV